LLQLVGLPQASHTEQTVSQMALEELAVIERELQRPEKRAKALSEIPVLLKVPHFRHFHAAKLRPNRREVA